MKKIIILYLAILIVFSGFTLQSGHAFDRNPTLEVVNKTDLQKYYLTREDYGEEKFPTPNASNWDVFWEKSQMAAQNIPNFPEEHVYRGMYLTPIAFEKILSEGLDPLLSSLHVLFFSVDAATAISYSRQLPPDNSEVFVNVVFQVDSKNVPMKMDGSYYVYEGPGKIPVNMIKAIYIFDKNFKSIENSFVKVIP